MDSRSTFTVGNWLVEPELDRISQGEQSSNIRPQVMDLLEYLADRPGQVVSPATLLRELWQGKVVTEASVYNCVAELRQALAEDNRDCYVETIPRRGYRLVAPVTGRERMGMASAGNRAAAEFPGWPKTLLSVVVFAFALGIGVFVLDRDRLAPIQAGSEWVEPVPSIAVMPFRDLSPGGDQAYFSDGITEELLNALAQLDDLRVISQSSAFSLRHAGLSTMEVGDRLNVGYVLEGSVRKSGNRVRITAQLIDAHSGTHLWSEAYDRALGDIFAVQGEIAKRVADELMVQISAAAPVAEVTHPVAFELYLKGRYEVSKRHLDNLRRAEAFFEQAIAVDPDYASAHAGLAKALLLQTGIHNRDPSLTRPRAEAALDRALALEPWNSDALATRGFMIGESNPEAARRLFEQAIARNPSNSDAYRWLALNCSVTDPARYPDLMRKASLVDPLLLTLKYHLTVALYRFGRYSEALTVAREWHELDSTFGGPDTMAARIHARSGYPDRALGSYYSAYRKNPDWNVPIARVSWLLAELGELSLAQTWSQEMRNNEAGFVDETAAVQEAMMAELGGRRDEALKALGEAHERNPDWWREVGRAWVFLGEFDRARETFERSLSRTAPAAPSISWEGHNIVGYALALQRTGATERAEAIIGEALGIIEKQYAAGMLYFGDWSNPRGSLLIHVAALHAMRGDSWSSLAALRQDISHGGVSCTICLRHWPQFENLRGDPEFEGLVAEQEARNSKWRRQLVREHLLLTPQQVLQLAEFTYDPFDEGQESNRPVTMND